MKKHILTRTELINENMGQGSVLLIKGKPTKEGRHLYVTYVKGLIDIRPGVRMVFLDNDIYRVVHKGGDKYSGVRVSFKNEAALHGVLNLKNQNRPSLVLNNNKTPFHWITLQHTDIGSALRELGSRITYGDNYLLESDNTHKYTEAYNIVTTELIKLITGRDSMLTMVDNNTEDADNSSDITEDEIADAEGQDTTISRDSRFMVRFIPNKVPEQYVDMLTNAEYLGVFDEEFGELFSDTFLDENLNIEISLFRDCEYSITYDGDGGNDTEYSGSNIDVMYIDGDDSYIQNTPDFKVFDSFVSDYDPDEFDELLNNIIKNSPSELLMLQWEYHTADIKLRNIKKADITDAVLNKWNFKEELLSPIITKVEGLIEELKQFREDFEVQFKYDDPKYTIDVDKNIKYQHSLISEIDRLTVQGSIGSFRSSTGSSLKYMKRHWKDSENNYPFELFDADEATNRIGELKGIIDYPKNKAKTFEHKYLQFNYIMDKLRLSKSEVSKKLENKSKIFEYFLNLDKLKV